MTPGDQLEDEILEALVDEAPLHVNEIAAHIDDHPLTVDRVCARLHDDGHVYPLGQGRYEVTSRGERRLADDPDPEVEAEAEPGTESGVEPGADS